eukprot:1148143-Pelagomonas_calceolata.AAC.2
MPTKLSEAQSCNVQSCRLQPPPIQYGKMELHADTGQLNQQGRLADPHSLPQVIPASRPLLASWCHSPIIALVAELLLYIIQQCLGWQMHKIYVDRDELGNLAYDDMPNLGVCLQHLVHRNMPTQK